METKNLSTNGAYQNEDVIWHQHSNKLMLKILEYFPKNIPVVDIGCGHNWYANTLAYLGYKAEGVDNVPLRSVNFIFDIAKGSLQHDNSKIKKTNVISLEVGEHIPAELSHNYFDNITGFKGDIIMSWAVKGQQGIGHINCQNNDWVIEIMKHHKYDIDHVKTASLREAVKDCHCTWFKNTLMYFIPCE